MAKAARAAAFVVLARPELSARVLAECVAEARQAGEHAALDRAERLAEALGERLVVCARDQRQNGLVRQMRKLTCGLRTFATPPAQRDHASLSPVGHG